MTGTISAVGAGGSIELKPGASATWSITNAHEFIGTVQLQRSTDLATWETIQSWIGTTGARLTETVGAGVLKNESSSHEYYRVACLVFDALSDNLTWVIALDLAGTVRGSISELITIGTGATTDSVANLLPANAIIEAVAIRVVAAIPTATTFTVGDPTTAARFATGVAVAVDTTTIGVLHRHPDAASAAAGPVQGSAAKVRITPNSTPGSAIGRVLVTVFYRQYSV